PRPRRSAARCSDQPPARRRRHVLGRGAPDHPDRRRGVVVLAALSALRRKTQNARFAAGVFVLAAVLGGCSSLMPQTAGLRESLAPQLHERVELKDVPFFAQDEYQCGPAALATVLANAGLKLTPEQLVPEVYLP